ncbi:MAG: hypothetical protein QOH74_1432 [Gaiellales bacterium]|jgi:hypothetical protein|nr:hypothetical protein [Gaiellales bacterium]
MARFRWFIAGAAAATGALVTAPGAYQRLRESLMPGLPRQLPPGDWPEREAPDQAEPAPATPTSTAVSPDEPAGDPAATPNAAVEDDDTRELRLRIDETRARIQRRAHEVASPDGEH